MGTRVIDTFPILYPRNCRKTFGFLVFSGDMKYIRKGSAKSQEFVLNIFQIFVIQIMCEFSGFNSYGKLNSKNCSF